MPDSNAIPDRVCVQFVASYQLRTGGMVNRGEAALVSAAEAADVVQRGLAVPLSLSQDVVVGEKAVDEPPAHKMMTPDQTKRITRAARRVATLLRRAHEFT